MSSYFGQTVYSFRIFFLISLWIHYINLNKIWIDYLFCEFTMNQLSSLLMYYGSTIKPLSFSRIHYEFTICFENLQWISFLICKFTMKREFTMISLSFTRIDYEFTFCAKTGPSGSLLSSRTTFKVIFSNSRLIIGLFWLRTCRIKKIRWLLISHDTESFSP